MTNTDNRYSERYEKAKQTMQQALTDNGFYRAADMFDSLSDYRDSKELAEKCRKNALEYRYNVTVKKMDSAVNADDHKYTALEFKKLNGYRDSDALAEKCLSDAKTAAKYSRYITDFHTAKKAEDYETVKKKFEKISFFKDSPDYIKKCEEKLLEKSDKLYRDAMQKKLSGKRALIEEAIRQFEEIPHYRDSVQKVEECRRQIDEIEQITKKKRIKFILAVGIIISLVVLTGVTVIIVKTVRYSNAVALSEKGKYEEAAEVFKELGSFKDSENKRSEAVFIKLKNEGKIVPGSYQNNISACMTYIMGIKPDGKVVEAGALKHGQFTFSDQKPGEWEHIVGVSAGGYDVHRIVNEADVYYGHHMVGLTFDGRVLAEGTDYYGESREAMSWRGVKAVSAGGFHTVGLFENGTVAAAGCNDDKQCEVSDWQDIAAVSAGLFHTVGLKSDGTVIATGRNVAGCCEVSDWKDIKAVSAGTHHTVGVTKYGTTVAVGAVEDESGHYDVSSWEDIVAVSSGGDHIVGLRSDGTVAATGDNGFGQCEVEDWKGIIAVSAGTYFTVGLRADGTVVSTSKQLRAIYVNDISVEEIFDWKLLTYKN